MHLGTQYSQNHSSGQANLFALFEESTSSDEYLDCPAWPVKQRLSGEKDTLGLYLTGHPVDPYELEFQAVIQPLAQLSERSKKTVLTCGLIVQTKKIVTKRGKQLVI